MKVILLLLPFLVYACTDFRYPSNAGVYSARTMDFPYPQLVQIKGVGPGEYFSPSDSQVSWVTNQSYISFTAYGINNSAEGMNRCGLSCSVLTLLETEYQNITNPKIALGITDLCDFVLGQFCSVSDAKTAISELEIFWNFITPGEPCPLVHASLHDEFGNSAVLEFIKGKQIWHDNLIGILTNDPTYDFQVKNVQIYSYCSNMFPNGDRTINNYTYDPATFAYSAGIPADDSPVSRFVRISQYIRFASHPDSVSASVILGFHLLEKVSVVPWFSLFQENSKTYHGVTIYRVVRDHTNKILYYSTYNDLVIKLLDVSVDITGVNGFWMENTKPHNYANMTGALELTK